MSKLNWMEAPTKTEWGAGMCEALIELSKDETLLIYAHKDALHLVEEALAAPPSLDSAKQRFDAIYSADDDPSPIERLRAFCSLVMSGQDWLDVEPFFDALAAPQPTDARTEFDYLLNRFERASQADKPAEYGYSTCRADLFAYVRRLEGAAQPLAAAPLEPVAYFFRFHTDDSLAGKPNVRAWQLCEGKPSPSLYEEGEVRLLADTPTPPPSLESCGLTVCVTTDGWQPIETVKPPPRHYLLTWDGELVRIECSGDDGQDFADMRVTHWMPLPQPPDATPSSHRQDEPESSAGAPLAHDERAKFEAWALAQEEWLGLAWPVLAVDPSKGMDFNDSAWLGWEARAAIAAKGAT